MELSTGLSLTSTTILDAERDEVVQLTPATELIPTTEMGDYG